VTELAASGATRTVERALALLAEVSEQESLTLSECARRTQLPASTALRLLRTLESSGFVVRDRTGGFRAGSRMIKYGALVLSRQSLVQLADAGMKRIVAATGESTYLGIAGSDETAIFIALVEGTHPVRHTSWVGRSFPLADLMIGDALKGRVPESGYLAGPHRLQPDITAIAAPITWPGGVAGALNLLGPTYRIDDDALHEYGRIVNAEARAIGAMLGGSHAARPGTPDQTRREVAT
jgi:IclR family transcriptional regulator, acetate operon repressor